MVAVEGGVADATLDAWEADSDEAMAASVAFVKLKPSGYVRTRLPGSPGRPNGG